MSELTREQVEDQCDVISEVSIDWLVRVSMARTFLSHDAALRASRDAERERAEKAERQLLEVAERNADLSAKLETMTLERNILYDTAVDDGLSAGTPTIDQAQELARMQSALADLEEKVVQIESQLPEGMTHCTIVFKECPKGHGRLTATNWVQHPCGTCERDQLQATVARLQQEIFEKQDVRLLTKLANANHTIDQLQATVTAQQWEIERLASKREKGVEPS